MRDAEDPRAAVDGAVAGGGGAAAEGAVGYRPRRIRAFGQVRTMEACGIRLIRTRYATVTPNNVLEGGGGLGRYNEQSGKLCNGEAGSLPPLEGGEGARSIDWKYNGPLTANVGDPDDGRSRPGPMPPRRSRGWL